MNDNFAPNNQDIDSEPKKDKHNSCSNTDKTISSSSILYKQWYHSKLSISAILFYCLCFSIIKPCSYWKSDTLNSITEQGKKLVNLSEECFSFNALPQKLNIYDAEVLIDQNNQKHGKLTDLKSKTTDFYVIEIQW